MPTVNPGPAMAQSPNSEAYISTGALQRVIYPRASPMATPSVTAQ